MKNGSIAVQRIAFWILAGFNANDMLVGVPQQFRRAWRGALLARGKHQRWAAPHLEDVPATSAFFQYPMVTPTIEIIDKAGDV